ncbi:MAG: AmmeMemoRadiSam system protein B [Planctomycetota bacterium]|nr:MAG: AmmeMemoRadiSam system protein B [Planctomycetota bacterium]
MNEQLKTSTLRRNILVWVIVLLSISGLLLWIRVPKPEEVAEPKKEEPVRLAKVVLRSSLAGRWYPDVAEELRGQIAGFFQRAEVKPIDNIIAFILPHAGYQYSGQTAAFGLKSNGREYKRIVIIGPSHRVPMEEMFSVPRVTHYETPLGQIPLDLEFIDKLLEYSVFQNLPRTHENEHSVQIELPLLQYCQDNFKLVPIVAGRCSEENINKAGAILRSLVDDGTLVIASSDFVHYGSNYGYVPFRENIPEQIKKLDMGAYEFIEAVDCKGFLEYRRRTGATICGYVPIAVLLSMLDKPVKAELVKYATSGELTGNFTNSVSYLSVVFSGTWGSLNPGIEPQASTSELTEEEKRRLLALARKSIAHFLQTRRVPQVSDLGITIDDRLKDPRAAFVTLKKDSQLRGCIGDIFPRQPLYKSVITNAIHASVNDRRFLPVTSDECGDITIEISALTAPEPVASPDKIRIGIDGVVLNKDGRSAVFLPQVAPEQGWDLNTMLTKLSLKAGLDADAWREGAQFLVFQAIVFGEEER